VCGVEVVGGGFTLQVNIICSHVFGIKKYIRHIQVDDYNHVEYIYALVGFPRNFKEIFHSFVHGEFVFSRGAAAVLCARPLNSIKFRGARAWTPLSRYSGRVGGGNPLGSHRVTHARRREMTKERAIFFWHTGEI